MNLEIKALIATIIGLTFLGMSAILGIIFFQPSINVVELGIVVGFFSQIILAVIAAFKGIQNSEAIKNTAEHIKDTQTNIKELKVSVDGNIENLVKQSTAVAVLTEQVASGKIAAEVAAKTAADTAIALAAKVDSAKAAVIKNGTHFGDAKKL